MKISVNGEPKQVSSTLLSELLVELGYGDANVATAVNEEFVPRPMREKQMIDEGDRIEIVTPRQGG